MIEIMKESTERMLAVKATGTLTDSDYTEVWVPALEKIINEYEVANTLLYLDEDFEGWDMKAMWEDVKFGYNHRNDFARIAIVGAPNWVQWGVKLGEMMIDSEIKIYAPDDLTEALDWVLQLPKCACEDCEI